MTRKDNLPAITCLTYVIVDLTKHGHGAFTFTHKIAGFYYFFFRARIYPSASLVLWVVRACDPGSNRCIRRNTF